MGEPFVGSEAVASGDVVKSALRTRYTRVFRDVYVTPGTELTPLVRARAGWLWSRRRGIVAGKSASALYGAKWIDACEPLELIHRNRNPLTGVRVHADRVDEDEVDLFEGVPVTTPTRTALDLACWYPLGEAVAAIDALARAVDLRLSAVWSLAQRTPGRRGFGRHARPWVWSMPVRSHPGRLGCGCGWSRPGCPCRRLRSRCSTITAIRSPT